MATRLSRHLRRSVVNVESCRPSVFSTGVGALAELGASPFSVNADEFKQVSKFETYKNYREQADQDGDLIVFDQKSAPEIVDATEDGKTLVYTNSELGSIGFVDISNPKINGERADSWSVVKPLSKYDVDGLYGPINKLMTLNEMVVFFQDRAFLSTD